MQSYHLIGVNVGAADVTYFHWHVCPYWVLPPIVKLADNFYYGTKADSLERPVIDTSESLPLPFTFAIFFYPFVILYDSLKWFRVRWPKRALEPLDLSSHILIRINRYHQPTIINTHPHNEIISCNNLLLFRKQLTQSLYFLILFPE